MLGGTPRSLLDRVAARYPGCLYYVATDEPIVALTLDDGPDRTTTHLILDELRHHGARATFFLITERLDGNEQVVRRLRAEGHELGNHFTRDRPSIGLGAEDFARDLAAAHGALAAYGPVRWARPGSGWYSRTMVAAMERAGYRCALGSVYPYDAAIPSTGFASRYILRNVRPGGIVVLHDGGERGLRTARVLRAVLPALRQRGYRVVTLSELVSRS
jgi:peptidoglycan-N-acetylglucosamine deacetylase